MRLIDADALREEMYRKSFETDDGRQKWDSGLWIRYKIFEEAIETAPTVDAVPVIRCKDCKFWNNTDKKEQAFCANTESDWLFSDGDCYCPVGERREK